MLTTINCKNEQNCYYHGSSSECEIQNMLLPPVDSDTLSEKGRLKNLDKVFFTGDFNSAKIYAGRACRQFGGNPVMFKVIPMSNIDCLNPKEGTTVFMSDWAFVEMIK